MIIIKFPYDRVFLISTKPLLLDFVHKLIMCLKQGMNF
jgi:hypothetical protein